AVAGDAHRDDLVAVGVDRGHDAARGETRDRMLRATAAEHDGDTNPAHASTSSHLHRMLTGTKTSGPRPYTPFPLGRADRNYGLNAPWWSPARRIAVKALFTSTIRSSASSSPTEKRTAPASMPAAASATSSSCRCVVEATWPASVWAPP